MSSRRKAQAAGWRLDELCHCGNLRIAWGGGDGFILPSVCWRCRRRVPHIVVGEDAGYDRDDPKHPDFYAIHVDIYDNREGK